MWSENAVRLDIGDQIIQDPYITCILDQLYASHEVRIEIFQVSSL